MITDKKYWQKFNSRIEKKHIDAFIRKLKGFTPLQRKKTSMIPHRRNPIADGSIYKKYFDEMDSA